MLDRDNVEVAEDEAVEVEDESMKMRPRKPRLNER